LVSVIASLRRLVWSLRGSSDGGYYLSNLWYLLGWLVDLGVLKLFRYPIYQGVTNVFLRQSHTTDPDGLTLLGIHLWDCVITL